MRWQYSLLGLLALTTAVALYLTFANHYPRLATGMFVGGGIWAAVLLFADRLVLFARSRSWALLTVAAWVMVGAVFLLLSLSFVSIDETLPDVMGSPSGMLGASLAGGALLCFLGAWRSLLRLRSAAENDKPKPTSPSRSNPPS